MKNYLVKNGLLVCAMLLALANTVSTMAEDINEVTVIATPSDIDSASHTDAHDEFDSEVAFLVDEVITELKAEWKDLDQEERQLKANQKQIALLQSEIDSPVKSYNISTIPKIISYGFHNFLRSMSPVYTI